jgi:toxin ParE1/3/4
MKKVTIYWTPFAVRCLDQVQTYIANETRSQTIATKYINKLLERVEQLENFSDSGTAEELLKHLKQNSRYLIEGNYKIIYQHQDNKVIITDIFHVKQNPVKMVKRNRK